MANGNVLSLVALEYIVYSEFSVRHIWRSLPIWIFVACRLEDIAVAVFEQDMVYISFDNELLGFAFWNFQSLVIGKDVS